ncbi:MAG: SdpI family protein [Sideroxyarcus sp.]|nr:SdpI family protein [Sideroxyarcus sp.]
MIIPIPYVQCGIGVLAILLSLPLVLRIIPMNRRYGIRVREAFASQRNWYEINAYGGKLLLAFGVFMLAFGYLGRDYAPPPNSAWAPVFLVIPLLSLAPVFARIKAFARQLPEH